MPGQRPQMLPHLPVDSEAKWRMLPKATLRAGDILVKKVFGGGGATERFIVAAQTVRPTPLGSRTSEHVAIMVDLVKVIEASGKGIATATVTADDHRDIRYVVYRHVRDDARGQAAQIARWFLEPLGSELLIAGKPQGGKYNLSGALGSLVRRSHLGARGEEKLGAFIDFVLRRSTKAPDLFCSEFVFLCYLAASIELDAPFPLLDPSAVSPKLFEHLLNENLTGQPAGESAFNLVGRYRARDGARDHWVPDEVAPACFKCHQQFTTIKRRHHCRCCGEVFCGSCSTRRARLPEHGHSSLVRVCDECYARTRPDLLLPG